MKTAYNEMFESALEHAVQCGATGVDGESVLKAYASVCFTKQEFGEFLVSLFSDEKLIVAGLAENLRRAKLKKS